MTKKKSLRDYWILIIIITIATLIINILNYFFFTKNFQDDINKRKFESANLINRKFDESILYVENFANFVGKRIASYNRNDPKLVAQVLESIRPNIDQDRYNIFTWTLFDFVNPEGYVVVASSLGVVEKPSLVKKERRSWMITSREKPWEAQFSRKDIGIISNEEIIPIGFGIVGENGKFLGYISLGMNVKRFSQSLKNIITDKIIKFAVLDENFNMVLSSDDFDGIGAIKNQLLKNKSPINKASIDVEGKSYYVEHGKNYPFYFVVGTNENAVNQEFWSKFFPKISNTIYLTIFFLILLYFFRVKLLSPVMNLSDITKRIASKDFDVLVPDSEIYEINVLADSIREMKHFLKQEEQEKQKLKKQKEKAEQENFGKTEFLSATVHDLKNHLIAILGAADLVRVNLMEKFSNKNLTLTASEAAENIEFLNNITDAAEELSSMVGDILDINQASTGNFKIITQDQIDIGALLIRTVNLLKTRATKNNQKLIYNFDTKNKKIIGLLLDPMRVKQILANLISNAIKYSPPNSQTEVLVRQLNREECLLVHDEIMHLITKNYKLDNKSTDNLAMIVAKKLHNRVSIIVKDEGFGMDEDEIKIALSKYGTIPNQNSEKVDSTGLGLPIVKYLIELQGGLMRIKSQKGKGTEVEVIL